MKMMANFQKIGRWWWCRNGWNTKSYNTSNHRQIWPPSLIITFVVPRIIKVLMNKIALWFDIRDSSTVRSLLVICPSQALFLSIPSDLKSFPIGVGIQKSWDKGEKSKSHFIRNTNDIWTLALWPKLYGPLTCKFFEFVTCTFMSLQV